MTVIQFAIGKELKITICQDFNKNIIIFLKVACQSVDKAITIESLTLTLQNDLTIHLYTSEEWLCSKHYNVLSIQLL